jgi:hypothetical protein
MKSHFKRKDWKNRILDRGLADRVEDRMLHAPPGGPGWRGLIKLHVARGYVHEDNDKESTRAG